MRCAGQRVVSLPKISTLPCRGGVRPTRLRTVVVLPAPLRPSTATISPSFTSSETPCRMWLLP